jgi:hypothetical protein
MVKRRCSRSITEIEGGDVGGVASYRPTIAVDHYSKLDARQIQIALGG